MQSSSSDKKQRARLARASQSGAQSASSSVDRDLSQQFDHSQDETTHASKRRRLTSPASSSATTSASAISEQEECGICFSREYEFSGKLNCCAHNFCFACVSRWGGESSNTCPHCKRRFNKLDKRNREGKSLGVKTFTHRDLATTTTTAASGVSLDSDFFVYSLVEEMMMGVYAHAGLPSSQQQQQSLLAHIFFLAFLSQAEEEEEDEEE